MLNRHDSVVLEGVARELDRLSAEAGDLRWALLSAAQLIRSVEGGGAELGPVADHSLDLEALRRALVGRGIVGEAARLTPQKPSLGYSKDTFLIKVEAPGQAPHVLVVRRDVPTGTTRTTVADEYPLLKVAFAAGLPVAEPLLLEEDPAVLGEVFMLTRAAPGKPDYLGWETDPARREAMARQLAEFMARLHALPTDGLPVRRLAPGGTPHEELAAYVGRWAGFWDECGRDDMRHVAEAFREVVRGLPSPASLAIVHGDVGFHNILVEDNRITAVVDWEFAHLGEPEEDLAYARDTIEGLTTWDSFIELYRAAGGPALSPERLQAWSIWRGLRNATCCAIGRYTFEAGLNADMRLAHAGRILLKMFADDVARQIQLQKVA